MNPTFGSGIRNLLFENINRGTTDSIEFILRDALRVYFPKLTLVDSSIDQQEDSNLVSFSIRYQIKNTQTEDELTINFE